MKFKKWLETFDFPNDMLSNPNNNEKTLDELIGELEKEGGGLIGRGKFGLVLGSPKWPYITKIFSNDQFYIPFVRFANEHPHSAFPKFYGNPQRIIPNFKRYSYQSKMYIVRIERLEPIDSETYKLIEKFYSHAISYFMAKERNEHLEDEQLSPRDINMGLEPRKVFQDVIDLFKERKDIEKLMEGMYLLIKARLKGELDIHEGNFMKRSNGELVIIDPFFEGTNPYMIARMMQRMEIDDHPDEPPPPDLIGGKLYKKPKPIKPKPYVYKPSDNDPPF